MVAAPGYAQTVPLTALTRPFRAVTCGLLFSCLSVPVVAWAQPAAPERVSLVAGAGVAFPFNADLDFAAAAWELGARAALSRRVALEVTFGEWRHEQTSTFADVPLPLPGGVTGRIGHVEERTRRTALDGAVTVLAGGRLGAVRVSGGGGVGVTALRQTVRQTPTGCTAPAALLCRETATASSSISMAVQGMGRLAVPVTSRLSAYVEGRLTAVARDLVGWSDVRVLAGGQVAF